MNTKTKTLFFLVFASIALCSCRKETTVSSRQYNFYFEKDSEQWQPFFSDFPTGREGDYELTFQYTTLPFPLPPSEPALQLHGNNHSDDLLSMIYHKITGLEPSKTYEVSFKVEFASKVATSSVGIGGSPDLALGAGGLSFAPANLLDDTEIERFNRPNFESKLQSREENANFRILGNIGVAENTTQFTIVVRDNLNNPLPLTTNDKGELWLMIGTDSGFEGPTTLYFKKIEVSIK